MTDGMSGMDETKDRVQSGGEKVCDDSGSFHFDVWLKFTVRADERLLSYIMGLIFFNGI